MMQHKARAWPVLKLCIGARLLACNEHGRLLCCLLSRLEGVGGAWPTAWEGLLFTFQTWLTMSWVQEELGKAGGSTLLSLTKQDPRAIGLVSATG